MTRYNWGVDGFGRQTACRWEEESQSWIMVASPLPGYHAKFLIWDLEEQDK